MFITEGVDLPEKVVDAHAAGRLVFFVGAGASMDTPSSLPSFTKLARDLADAARIPFDADVAVDLFLGSMPSNFDVHAHAHRLISRKDSTPNPTHKAIVRVASATGAARIVTTNFDDHLSSAAVAEAIAIDDRWVGPALPVGDAFAGVVHLHGSVLRSPSELVLTDRDFGRAYLTDAWATRFLQRMFDEFTVLFIGYSLDDPIMRYLSLGLPSKTRRYVLTHKPADDKWSHLGILPIPYPGTDEDHSALLEALEAWDSRARMGQLDHRARMREIVVGGPTLTPVDRDYVIRRIRTVEGATDFAQVATTVDWLRWVEGRPRFRALFNGGRTEDSTSVLANWFGTFIVDPDLHGAALQSVSRLGQQFAPALVSSASWSAEHLSRADGQAGRRWKTVLASSVHGYSAPPKLGLLLPHKPKDGPESIAMTRAALRPFLTLKPSWSATDDDGTTLPDAVVDWHAREASLTAHLQQAISEADRGDATLGALLEDSLNSAYDLLDGFHGDRKFDPLGFGRSAIEAHGQDSHRDPEDAIIDALRDFGTKALEVSPGLPERWWSNGRPLFRRLALHVLAVDQSRSPDDKICWLLDRDLLYARHEKHETFQVLAAALPGAGDSVRTKLLAAASLGPDYADDMTDRDRHVAYSTYNLLAWLTRSAPDWVEAADEFAFIQAANQTFAIREHPDFDQWWSGGTWGGQLPVDPEDFIRDAEGDLPAAFADLINRDYSERNFNEPTWDDALSLVRQVSEKLPALGVRIWQLIETRDDLDERKASFKRAVLGGWERADLGDDAEAVSGCVATEALVAESARSISQFLLAQIQKLVESEETPAIVALRELALTLWTAHNETFAHGPESEFSFLALNSWPGELASYWVVEIDRRWRHNRDDWRGLLKEESNALTQLLNGPPATQDATRPALASAAYFLFAADPDFVEAQILPLFRDVTTAQRMWGSYLYNARTDDRMLRAGLLDGMVLEWGGLDSLGEHGLQDQFHNLAASVLCFAGLDRGERQRLLDASVLAKHGQYAASFATAVVRLLQPEGVRGAEVWDRWLRDHFIARLDGLPRTALREELARWADVVPFLGERVPDAAELVRGRGIGLGEEYYAPDFPEGALSQHTAELIGHLAERVRNSDPSGWHLPHEVAELTQALGAVLGNDAVKPVLDAARERGFNPE